VSLAEKHPTVEEAISRLRQREPGLKAFVATRLDAALKDAEARRRERPRSPLHGLPYSLKDMWDVAGLPTTGGSFRYREQIAQESGPVHRAFEAAGAVLLGKTNLSDMGLAPEASSYVGGQTRNPYDPTRTAGGSSGGAAAAVASGISAFEWGTDFGGSVRLPAGYCGVLGMRLSNEAWPVVGMFPAVPEPLTYMNGQGPITADLATMRAALSAAAPTLKTGKTRPFALKGVFVNAPSAGFEGRWPGFAADAAKALAKVGCEVRGDHKLPSAWRTLAIAQSMYCAHFEDMIADDPLGLFQGMVAAVSAIALRGRLFGDKRLHPTTAEMLLMTALGRVLLYRDKRAARESAARLRAAYDDLWARGYLVAAPTSVYPAPRHGRGVRHPLTLACTMPGNVVDATGLALPLGRFDDGLPRSMQLLGPPGSEEILIAVAEKLVPPGPLTAPT
jgi:amidase